ncbi:MAG: protein NO VEIN domain-containing protein [Planktothrix sp.]
MNLEIFPNQANPLDDEAYEVVLNCWKFLSRESEKETILASKIKERLGTQAVIPNKQRILQLPERIFFEDRPNLIEKFSVLQNNDNVLSQEDMTLGAWFAMQAAGVHPLSEVISAELINCPQPERNIGRDEVLQSWVQQYRQSLLKRVTIGQKSGGTHSQWKFEILTTLTVKQAQELEVRYSLITDNTSLGVAEPFTEKIQVYFDRDENILYYCETNQEIPWALIARELAYVLNSDIKVGQIAAGIKEVISAPSREQANKILEELGYAPYSDSEEELPQEPKLPSYSTAGDAGISPLDYYQKQGNYEDSGTGDDSEYWGKIGERWAENFYKSYLSYNCVDKQNPSAGYDYRCSNPTDSNLKKEIYAEVKARSEKNYRGNYNYSIRITSKEWSTLMDPKNREKYELLLVRHKSQRDEKFNSVFQIIRIRSVWPTLSSVFSVLSYPPKKLTSFKYKLDIETLIGLQQTEPKDSAPLNNTVILNWDRLIESNPKHPNITIYKPLSETTFELIK